jgi:ABC-type dipeptide/oligopeptide/nickel transport system permease subunit
MERKKSKIILFPMPGLPNQSFTFAQLAWKRLRKNRGAMIGLMVICIAIFLSIFAYFIALDKTPGADRQIVEIQAMKPGHTQLFIKLNKEKNITPPGFLQQLLYGVEDKFYLIPINSYQLKTDSVIVHKYIDEGVEENMIIPLKKTFSDNYIITQTFWLGTDRFGRDILSRLIVGVRVSLAVGLIAVIISLTVGVLLGCIAGYFKGIADEIIMWLINVIWSIPTLLLVFGITLALGKGFWQIFIAVGLTMWVSVARLIRGQVLGLRELEYIQAAKALGLTNVRIIARHILPNVLGPVIVIAASNFATAIIVEAGLSFLGVGVQPPQPSWGLMIKENYNFIITHNPVLALAPGIAIMILVFAFNLLGNGLRDALDVKGRL